MNKWLLYDSLVGIIGHIRFNSRQIIIATIGLIISLAIISSASIFVDSQRMVLVEDLFENAYIDHWRIDFTSDFASDIPNEVQKVVNESLVQYNLNDKIDNIYYQRRIDSDFILTDNSSQPHQSFEWLRPGISEFEAVDLSLLEPYFLYPIDTTNYTSDSDEYNILYSVYGVQEDYYGYDYNIPEPEYVEKFEVNKSYELIFGGTLRQNVTISNIVNISIYELKEIFGFQGFYGDQGFPYWYMYEGFPFSTTLIIKDYSLLLKPETLECGRRKFIEPEFNESDPNFEPKYYEYFNFSLGSTETCDWSLKLRNDIWITFDLNKFDVFQVDSQIKDFEDQEIFLVEKFTELGFYSSYSPNHDYIYINNNIKWLLLSIQSIGIVLFTAIMLFTFPIIIIAIFLAYYSFGLIQKNVLQGLNIYLTRGISRIQYFSFLTFEMLFSLLLALIFAIVLSIPITSLSLRSSDFFEFNSFIAPLIFIYHLINLLIQFGIILALLTNIFRIVRLTRLDLSQLDRVTVEERHIPLWRKKYLDIILLGLGALFYGLTAYSFEFNVHFPAEFYLLFSLPSPLFIIVGCVMVTSRLFSIVTGFIGSFLWEHQGGLSSFSLKNITKHSHSATRALILTSLTLAFALSFLIFPVSFISYAETSSHYHLGADIVIEVSNNVNITFYDYLLANFSDQLEGYSPVSEGALNGQSILVINTTTFLDAAWMRDDFGPNLEESIQRIGEKNDSILLYHDNLIYSDSKIGEKFLWKDRVYYDYYPDVTEGTSSNPEFTIEGEFYYWPRLLWGKPWQPQNELFGIMSYQSYFNLNASLGEDSLYLWSTKLYVKPKPSMNQTFFREELSKIVGVFQIDLYNEQLQMFRENPLYLVIIGQINSNIIYCVIIIFTILAMFGFKQLIERSKEIATERAVGMTLFQTFKVFLIETLWLIFFSIIIGIIFGVLFSSLFLLGLTGPSFPPFSMVLPWHLISIIVGILITFGVLFSFIPAFFSSQLEVNKLLKVE